MRETLTQHSGLASALLVALFLLILFSLLFAYRRRRRRASRTPQTQAAPPPPCRPCAEKQAARLDAAALTLAVEDAEARGEAGRLPGLYLSLAQCLISEGEAEDASELLRKSILGAAGAGLKDTHARARLALGDLAYKNGDLTTACEHWQIARALFHELKQVRDHASVEQRMLSNGCPTDWVLTDF